MIIMGHDGLLLSSQLPSRACSVTRLQSSSICISETSVGLGIVMLT